MSKYKHQVVLVCIISPVFVVNALLKVIATNSECSSPLGNKVLSGYAILELKNEKGSCSGRNERSPFLLTI